MNSRKREAAPARSVEEAPPAPADRALLIGASAGGIAALQVLLPRLKPVRRAAVVVVLHLHPQTNVPLPHIFPEAWGLSMQEAEEKQPMLPGHIYFAPPAYHLLVERNRSFSLNVDDPVSWARPSIDVLFQTAARAFGRQTTAVLLTGANSDGAEGCAEVQKREGRVIVQHPDDAEISSMPRAALSRCKPDYVLPLTSICELLARLGSEGTL